MKTGKIDQKYSSPKCERMSSSDEHTSEKEEEDQKKARRKAINKAYYQRVKKKREKTKMSAETINLLAKYRKNKIVVSRL